MPIYLYHNSPTHIRKLYQNLIEFRMMREFLIDCRALTGKLFSLSDRSTLIHLSAEHIIHRQAKPPTHPGKRAKQQEIIEVGTCIMWGWGANKFVRHIGSYNHQMWVRTFSRDFDKLLICHKTLSRRDSVLRK